MTKQENQEDELFEAIAVVPDNTFLVFSTKSVPELSRSLSSEFIRENMKIRNITGVIIPADCTIEMLNDEQLATIGLFRKEPVKLDESKYH